MATRTLNEIVKQASAWPKEDQEELVDYARVIEARRTGTYRVSDAERTALEASLAEAERGEFEPEANVTAVDKRRGA